MCVYNLVVYDFLASRAASIGGVAYFLVLARYLVGPKVDIHN